MSKLLKNRVGVLVVMVCLGAGGAALLRAQVRMDQPERLRLDSQRLAWMLANLKAAGHPGSWWGGWSAAFQTWRRGVFPSGSHLVVASLS